MSEITGKNIRRLLELTNATHDQLAKIAGVDRSAVSHWKSGKAEPRMGHLQRIADYYGITTANLVNPNGMKHVRIGTDGKLHDDRAARVAELRRIAFGLSESASENETLSIELAANDGMFAQPTLASEECELLDMFRSLNDEGKKLALSTLAAFVKSGSYN